MSTQNPTKKEIEAAIKLAIKAAADECDTYIHVSNDGRIAPDDETRLTRMKRLACNEVYFNYAAHLGDNAYIRQVRHGEEGGSSHTTWEVGIFKKIGEYKILTDERQPAAALAKALHATGAILPAQS